MDQVICICDDWRGARPHYPGPHPIVGGVYTPIRTVRGISGLDYFILAEFSEDQANWRAYLTAYFRPVRHTSIEGLRRALCDQLEDA